MSKIIYHYDFQRPSHGRLSNHPTSLPSSSLDCPLIIYHCLYPVCLLIAAASIATFSPTCFGIQAPPPTQESWLAYSHSPAKLGQLNLSSFLKAPCIDEYALLQVLPKL